MKTMYPIGRLFRLCCLSLLLLCLVLAGCGEDPTLSEDVLSSIEGKIVYTVEEDHCSVKAKGTLRDTDIVIADSYEGLPVTEIAIGAFRGQSALCSVTLPESIMHIGNNAFMDCSSLQSIALPQNLESLGTAVFAGCLSLERAILPQGLATLPAQTFENCKSLLEIEIPEGMTTIGKTAFADCRSLSAIRLPGTFQKGEVGAFRNCNRMKLYVDALDTFLQLDRTASGSLPDYFELYIDGEVFREMVFPEGIDEIPENVFSGCRTLQKVVIPEGVKSIGENAFLGTELEMVTLPSSLEIIEAGAFRSCMKLKAVTFPDGLQTIGSYAFSSCSQITEIRLPDSLTALENGAFAYCFGLVSVNIPTSITTIADSLFTDCRSLTRITLPEGTTSLGPRAFRGCISLAEISLPSTLSVLNSLAFSDCDALAKILIAENNPVYSSSGSCVMHKETKTLVAVCGDGIHHIPDDGSVLRISAGLFQSMGVDETLILPSGLEVIEEEAFGNFSVRGGKRLIILQDGLKELEHRAFYAAKISAIVLPNSVERIGESAFAPYLSKIFFEGTKTEWEAVTIVTQTGESVDFLEGDPSMYYYSEQKPSSGDSAYYWHYVNGEPEPW